MILVTGGTGFVGREVVRELHALGYPVRLLVRDPRKAHDLVRQYGCEVVRGDVLKPETLDTSMQDVDAVIHLVGIIAETPKVSYEQAHVQGTRNVVLAAMAAGVKRFIHMSALGTRPGARSRYHQTKWDAEIIVLWSGMDWTIFRPSLIYGPNDNSVNVMASLMKLPFGLFPNLGGGHGRVQPISVGEVARCIAHSVSNPRSLKIVYAPAGPYSLFWREAFGVIASVLKKEYVFDEWGGLFLLRTLLWAAALLLPPFLVIAALVGWVALPSLIAFGVSWLIAAWACANWRTIIFFRFPLRPLIAFSDLIQKFTPSWMQFGEPLKMLQEDNEADPKPSAEAFQFSPVPFVVGAAKSLK